MLRNFLFVLSLFFIVNFSSAQEVNSLQTQVPTEILFKKNNQYNFTISPGGAYFAEIIDVNGKSDIVIIDIDNYSLLHRIPISDHTIEALYWLTDRRLLLVSEGAIFAIDIDGQNSMLIVDHLADKINYNKGYKNLRYNSLMSLMPEKKHQILIETHNYSGYASIVEVNIFTGKKYIRYHANQFKVNKWFLDSRRVPRLALRITDDGVAYEKFNPDTEKFTPFRIKINDVSYSLDVTKELFLDKELTFEGFADHPDIILLTSNIDSDKRELIAYDIEKEEVVETLVQDVNCDVIDITGRGVRMVYDYANGMLAGVAYEGLVPQYKWFSADFQKHYEAMNKLYPTYFNEFLDSNTNSERIVVLQQSDTNAGNVGIFDTKTNTYSVMAFMNEELNPYALSKTKSIMIDTRDGYSLSAYLNLPVGYEAGKEYPLVVIPHGGPWSRDYWGMDEFALYFSSRGYITLRPNFRGSTGFGNSHMTAGLQSMDKIMIDDIADATRDICEKYSVAEGQVFIFGHSYGGYAAYMSLLKYAGLFVSGVAVSAPTDLKTWMKEQKKDKHSINYEFWTKALGSKRAEYLDEISPVNYVKMYNRPLLVFHGKYDDIIPVAQAEMMVKKLKAAKKKATIEILQSEGHSITDSNVLGYLLDTSSEFFQKVIQKENNNE